MIWAIGNSRPVHVIMRKTPKRGRYSKTIPCPRGGDPAQASDRNGDRNLVAGRSQGRTKNQNHPALGEPGNASLGPMDQRTRSAYIFGAIRPARGVGAALILPRCNTAAMILHLQEISVAIAPGAHAIVIVDQAGWHFSKALEIPDNITLLPLPAKWPELNPVGNVWQFMRDNWLSNRIFKSYNDIVDHCCFAWNQLIDQPWRIMSIGMRDWAHQ